MAEGSTDSKPVNKGINITPGDIDSFKKPLEITPADVNPDIEITSSQLISPQAAIEITLADVIGDRVDTEPVIEIDGEIPASTDSKRANEMVKNSLIDLQEAYASREFDKKTLDEHHVQQARSLRGWGCVPSSSLNALDALGMKGGYTEQSVIDAMGGFTRADGFIGEQEALNFLRSQPNIFADASGDWGEMMENLVEKDGVSILTYAGHARLISGAENTGVGEIMLRVNDPLNQSGKTELVPLGRMAADYLRTEPTQRGMINIRKQEVPHS